MKTSRNSKHISVKRLLELAVEFCKNLTAKEYVLVSKFIMFVSKNRNK